jgi:hypothetical protein
MDTILKSFLQKIDQGDFQVIPRLAEWLQTQGDPRAELARQATTLGPKEIANELVKVRSVRPSNDYFLSILAELGLWGFWHYPTTFDFPRLEYAPKTPRWWPPDAQKCNDDVEKALETKVLPADIARAMTNARRIKVDRLLAAFQSSEQPTPLSPPGPD